MRVTHANRQCHGGSCTVGNPDCCSVDTKARMAEPEPANSSHAIHPSQAHCAAAWGTAWKKTQLTWSWHLHQNQAVVLPCQGEPKGLWHRSLPVFLSGSRDWARAFGTTLTREHELWGILLGYPRQHGQPGAGHPTSACPCHRALHMSSQVEDKRPVT